MSPTTSWSEATASPVHPGEPVDDALHGHHARASRRRSVVLHPRQLVLYDALRAVENTERPTPASGIRRDGRGQLKNVQARPGVPLNMYRESGYPPEGLTNYLALLGWSIGDDRESSFGTTMATLEVSRVNPNPARFGPPKCRAINGDWIRFLPADEIGRRLVPCLRGRSGGGSTHRGISNGSSTTSCR